MLKLFKPYMSLRSGWYVLKTLYSGQLAEGPRVKQFEHEFSHLFSLTNVVAVNSGTTALELAYELAGIGKNDEVITPVLTCTATNIPLLRRGAKIVFADIDKDLNVSVQDVERRITKRTKAIVFVHFGGCNRGLREVVEIGKKYHIPIIEDAAQAVGSDYWGKADFTAVSLQAIKTLTSGDGGFLICKRKEDYEKARRLRWYGYDRELKQKLGDTDLKEAGYKYHMNDITAAIGLGNLRSLKKVLMHRADLAQVYRSYGLFANIWLAGGISNKPFYPEFYQFPTAQYHFRNDKYTLFGTRRKDLPMMDKLERIYFFVPYHYGVSIRQAHKIGKLCQPYLATI